MLRINKARGPAGEAILRLTGVLREESMDTLAQELESALRQGEVILDLSELTYLDSAGTTFLRRARGRAAIVNASPFVEGLLARPDKGGGDR